MSHNHSHSHAHHTHDNLYEKSSKAFLYGIILNAIYIAVEAGYGLAVNSMALIADAGHNLSDVLGLILAWGASYLAKSKADTIHTYGKRKSTILAAFINSIILFIAVGGISIEAIRKFLNPQPIEGEVVMLVAGVGVVVNTLTALLFIKDKDKDLNIKGAFLHMAADALVSVGVVVSGYIITITNFYLIDSIISFVIVIVISWSTWGLLKDSFKLSMDAVPDDFSYDEIKNYLLSLDDVTDVHDLHIWPLSTTETALTVHLVRTKKEIDDKFLNDTIQKLEEKFSINHSTIQLERENNCKKCEL